MSGFAMAGKAGLPGSLPGFCDWGVEVAHRSGEIATLPAGNHLLGGFQQFEGGKAQSQIVVLSDGKLAILLVADFDFVDRRNRRVVIGKEDAVGVSLGDPVGALKRPRGGLGFDFPRSPLLVGAEVNGEGRHG